jgi:hypothetical protein
MSIVIRSIPRASQPRSRPRLDPRWGFRYAWLPSVSEAVDDDAGFYDWGSPSLSDPRYPMIWGGRANPVDLIDTSDVGVVADFPGITYRNGRIVNFPQYISGTNAWTMMFVVKYRTLPTVGNVMTLAGHYDAGTKFNLQLYNSGGGAAYWWFDGNNGSASWGNLSPLLTGEWLTLICRTKYSAGTLFIGLWEFSKTYGLRYAGNLTWISGLPAPTGRYTEFGGMSGLFALDGQMALIAFRDDPPGLSEWDNTTPLLFNPWQIFAPAQRVMPIPVGAGSPASFPLMGQICL